MNKIICMTPAAPLRKEPSHRSEMVSQLLFNETASVIDEETDFIKLRCDYDGYEGWCQRRQLAFINNDIEIKGYTTNFITNIILAERPVNIGLATPVCDNILQQNYNLDYIKVNDAVNDKAHFIQAIALKYLNVPYLWGGKTVFGIDCSGLVQQVFKLAGIKLLRDAYQQATQGETIHFLQEATCGDLAFFDNDEGGITHVGILLNDSSIIHASGFVRIDKIDNAGIIDDKNERTHKLRIIKRVI